MRTGLPVSLAPRLIACVLLCLDMFAGPAVLAAAQSPATADEFFSVAMEKYHDGQFRQALPHFESAVELEAGNSQYQHMLGKCYGRIAEHGSWLTALRYVGRTLQQFEIAVELDPGNLQAWRDLEEFYRRAPGFLGGDREKAGEIRKFLDTQVPPERVPDGEADGSAPPL